ncbi:hypothetical protein TrVGV298_001633 [Trichoderma virens]|nr:hypothetical protein TrVGV298_001633 [Trichoderma virens]
MAPGYRSPFDHAPSPKPIHIADGALPILAILLCVSIILCLALFTFCVAAAKHSQYLQPKDDNSVPAPEMAFDQSSVPKYLAVHSSEDSQRGNVQQPLLPTETYNSSPGEDVETAIRRAENVYKGSISWHGINTLNTSWGWMA